jgi:hypothetical protein
MIRSTRISLLSVFAVAGLSATLLHSSPARAESPFVVKMAPGIGGPVDPNGLKNASPGNEQLHSTWLQKNGHTYVVSVYMSGNVSDDDRPWQCKCSSVEIDPKTGPRVLANADQVQLTHGAPGDRPCNHPRIASDGTNMIWIWGSDDHNNNVETYVSGIDEMCNMTTKALKVSTDPNNNEGAADIVAVSPGLFTAGYLSTGNNDRSIALGLTVDGQGQITKTWQTKVVTPSNIGRPSIEMMDAGHSLFCAAKGNNRPPEDGVECSELDACTGDNLKCRRIAASDPNNK